MAGVFTPPIVGLIGAAILLAGVITGIAGFGFAIVGTMALAAVFDPATAVVFMLLPIVAVNLALVRDLSGDELRSCAARFGPLIAAALVGTLVGMVVLERLPGATLRVGLGLLSLAFVAGVQEAYRPAWIERVKATCFVESVPAMVAIGGLSGVVFGGTNVGVQLIAYLRSRELSHGTFVGVVAMVFLGLNAIRVGAAGLLELYPGVWIVAVSIAASLPAVLGVWVGKRLRGRLSPTRRRGLVLGLLTIVGLRLTAGGLGLA